MWRQPGESPMGRARARVVDRLDVFLAPTIGLLVEGVVDQQQEVVVAVRELVGAPGVVGNAQTSEIFVDNISVTPSTPK